MKPLLKKRNEILEVAQEIAQKAQSEDRALTAEEIEQIDGHATEIEQIDEQIKSSSAALAKLAGVGKVDGTAFAKAGDQAGSLGEHAIREIGSRMAEFKNSTGQRSFGTTEFKAATDTHRIADVQGGVPVQVDRTVVQDYRPGPTIDRGYLDGARPRSESPRSMPDSGQIRDVASRWRQSWQSSSSPVSGFKSLSRGRVRVICSEGLRCWTSPSKAWRRRLACPSPVWRT